MSLSLSTKYATYCIVVLLVVFSCVVNVCLR